MKASACKQLYMYYVKYNEQALQYVHIALN